MGQIALNVTDQAVRESLQQAAAGIVVELPVIGGDHRRFVRTQEPATIEVQLGRLDPDQTHTGFVPATFYMGHLVGGQAQPAPAIVVLCLAGDRPVAQLFSGNSSHGLLGLNRSVLATLRPPEPVAVDRLVGA